MAGDCMLVCCPFGAVEHNVPEQKFKRIIISSYKDAGVKLSPLYGSAAYINRYTRYLLGIGALRPC